MKITITFKNGSTQEITVNEVTKVCFNSTNNRRTFYQVEETGMVHKSIEDATRKSRLLLS